MGILGSTDTDYFCQNLPIPIIDPILILHMSSNYSLYIACIYT